jgi:two-component system, LytTR family, response regulator
LHDHWVNAPAKLSGNQALHPLSATVFYGVVLLLVPLAYFTVFRITRDTTVTDDLIAAVCNAAPLAILIPAAQAVLTRFVIGGWPWAQLFAHVPLSIGFSLLWYWLVMVAYGVSQGTVMEFRVERFFPTSAASWQLIQGITVYGLIASLTVSWVRQPLYIFSLPPRADERRPGVSRYFIRQGEEIHPIEIGDIVSITGADDYAEVATTKGKHLVRMTLGDFERALDGKRFSRVHRSRIVNVDRIERAEPAGAGRMLLHMQNGDDPDEPHRGQAFAGADFVNLGARPVHPRCMSFHRFSYRARS